MIQLTLLWRWPSHRLSKRQSLSTTTVQFRTTFIRTIKLNLLLKWPLGSNLSQLSNTVCCTNCIKLCNYAIHVDTMTKYIVSGLFRIIFLIPYGDQTNLLLDTYDSLFTLLWICISNYVERTHWGPGIMTLFNEFKYDFILINISLLYMLWEVDSFLFS